MSQTDDGGPAYPGYLIAYNADHGFPKGMTLLDYFAGQALVALVSHQYVSENLPPEDLQDVATAKRYTFTHDTLLEGRGDLEQIARHAYNIAHAMLAARRDQP